jgi:predicted amidohydrolase YtcJ
MTGPMSARLNKSFTLAGVLMLALAATDTHAQDCRQLVLYNGRISTMETANETASSVVIDGDRIAAVSDGRGIPKHEACAKLIDLRGRRVIPGLIDGHNHFVVASQRPGHDVRLELAAAIAEVQKAIREKAGTLAVGEWITSVAGWTPEQLAEKRMPTLAELDAASPQHAVYIQTGFDGPSATNSRGRAFLEAHGVKIGDDGRIDANAPTVAAYNALVADRTLADRERSAMELMAYAAGLGLTTSDDKGGPWPANNAVAGDKPKPNRTNALDPYTGYDHLLALMHEGRMLMRLRVFFYMQDTQEDLPFLKARLNNQYPDFGNDWFKAAGIGERLYEGGFPSPPTAPPDTYLAAARLVAQKGWAHDEHAGGLADEKAFTDAWEQINRETPLAPLRWCLAHVPGIDAETLSRLKAIGVGVSAAGGRYAATTPPRTSPKEIPPFRLLMDSGIHVGYGSDGGTVAPLNPWLHMYYMVTGFNSAGQQVAPGQTLTRMEALKMYTSNQPWFTNDDDKLGSIKVGKLADIVVLSDDILDPHQVPDEAIRRIHSLLTIVGGRIVYDDGSLKATPVH